MSEFFDYSYDIQCRAKESLAKLERSEDVYFKFMHFNELTKYQMGSIDFGTPIRKKSLNLCFLIQRAYP